MPVVIREDMSSSTRGAHVDCSLASSGPLLVQDSEVSGSVSFWHQRIVQKELFSRPGEYSSVTFVVARFPPQVRVARSVLPKVALGNNLTPRDLLRVVDDACSSIGVVEQKGYYRLRYWRLERVITPLMQVQLLLRRCACSLSHFSLSF